MKRKDLSYAECYEKALEIMAKPDDDYSVTFNLPHIVIKEGEITHAIEKGAWLRARTSFGLWDFLCKFSWEDAAALNAQNIYWRLQNTLRNQKKPGCYEPVPRI